MSFGELTWQCINLCSVKLGSCGTSIDEFSAVLRTRGSTSRGFCTLSCVCFHILPVYSLYYPFEIQSESNNIFILDWLVGNVSRVH